MLGTDSASILCMTDAIKEAANKAWVEQSDLTEANLQGADERTKSHLARTRLYQAGFRPSYDITDPSVTVWSHTLPSVGRIVMVDAGFLGTLTRWVE